MDERPGVLHIAGSLDGTVLWWRFLPSGELICGEVERIEEG